MKNYSLTLLAAAVLFFNASPGFCHSPAGLIAGTAREAGRIREPRQDVRRPSHRPSYRPSRDFGQRRQRSHRLRPYRYVYGRTPRMWSYPDYYMAPRPWMRR